MTLFVKCDACGKIVECPTTHCQHTRRISGVPGEFRCTVDTGGFADSVHDEKRHHYVLTSTDFDDIDKLAFKAAIYDAEQDFTQACKDAVDGKRGPLTPEEIDAFKARGVSMAPSVEVKVKRAKR